MRMRLFFILTVVALLSAFAPGTVAAQEQQCGVCDQPSPSEETHHFHTWNCDPDEDLNCYDCEEGRPGHAGCHTEELADECDFWHAHCDEGASFALRLMEAYEDRGLPAATQLVASNPEWFHLNTARSAVQSLGCGDGVIAHLPLPSDEFERLASSLATPDQTTPSERLGERR